MGGDWKLEEWTYQTGIKQLCIRDDSDRLAVLDCGGSEGLNPFLPARAEAIKNGRIMAAGKKLLEAARLMLAYDDRPALTDKDGHAAHVDDSMSYLAALDALQEAVYAAEGIDDPNDIRRPAQGAADGVSHEGQAR